MADIWYPSASRKRQYVVIDADNYDDDDNDNDEGLSPQEDGCIDLTQPDEEESPPKRARSWKDARQPFNISREDYEIRLEEQEDECPQFLGQVIDLTGDDPPLLPRNRHSSSGNSRRSTPRSMGKTINQYRMDNGLLLKPGMTIELKEYLGHFKIKFLKIHSIIFLENDKKPTLRGWSYARNRSLRFLLERKLNEVCMIVRLDDLDPRPWQEQALMDLKLKWISGKRELRTTNESFPLHRYPFKEYEDMGADWVKQNSRLVCRYRFEEYYSVHGPSNRQEEKPREWAFVRMAHQDADPNFRHSDEEVLRGWRWSKTPEVAVDLDGDGPGSVLPSTRYRYSAGDVFAGAGGASRGIKSAGLDLVFAIDNWADAAATLRRNFHKTKVYKKSVSDVIIDKDVRHRVDILHLSPPCQPYSPAHTRVGKNDDINTAALYSCTELVDKFRPRLFTLEQTYGILHAKSESYFKSLVRGFTTHGYSVRWKVAHLANYGLAQPRKRLIMIGAGPGDKLPPFPPPTHHKDGINGLKPWETVTRALSHLSEAPDGPYHQPANYVFNTPRAPWNPDKILSHTITCCGTLDYHWDGERAFTPLELAALQGFPQRHKFVGTNTSVKKQIGNAFPSSVVKILYRHLAAWLDKQDRPDHHSDDLTVVGARSARDINGNSVLDNSSPLRLGSEGNDSSQADNSDVEIQSDSSVTVTGSPEPWPRRPSCRPTTAPPTGSEYDPVVL
ncbi:S-adenosyl-L-methionine-dependent methyltransferase [Bombardia bombarda]|uniref:DNA (cytosine-5-)-methyltransferase n=1 Tax=Bombardia bombarda TaxID=252184 RepID=A0AA39WI55_9PEZI|nr:S-adenosyl-L-methionine-dependent methyltransferase [Bombardia bombarda]